MSATHWDKWFWADWAADVGLRRCSYAARGLWADMLGIAAAAEPRGMVSVNGKVLDNVGIARITGGSVEEVTTLILELETNGVFSRTKGGMIYNRRMNRDRLAKEASSKGGKTGGRVTYGKKTGIFRTQDVTQETAQEPAGERPFSPPDDTFDDAQKGESKENRERIEGELSDLVPQATNGNLTHINDTQGATQAPMEESRYQKPNTTRSARGESPRKRQQKPLTEISADWQPSAAGIAYAEKLGLRGPYRGNEIESFKNWHGGKGNRWRDWDMAWRNWVLSWAKDHPPKIDQRTLIPHQNGAIPPINGAHHVDNSTAGKYLRVIREGFALEDARQSEARAAAGGNGHDRALGAPGGNGPGAGAAGGNGDDAGFDPGVVGPAEH